MNNQRVECIENTADITRKNTFYKIKHSSLVFYTLTVNIFSIFDSLNTKMTSDKLKKSLFFLTIYY